MKKAILIAVSALLCTAALAQDGKSIYNKYAGKEGVTGVYISEAMFQMIGDMPELPLGDVPVDVTPYLRSMEGLYLLEMPHADAGLAEDVQKFVAAGNYQPMMEVKDSGTGVNMYFTKEGEFITSLVLLVSESSECVFICLDCRISEEDFQKLISEAMKNA